MVETGTFWTTERPRSKRASLFEEGEILHDERTVETERLAQRVDIGLGRRLGNQQVGRIAGQPLQEEDQRDHTEDRADDLAEPPGRKLLHDARPAPQSFQDMRFRNMLSFGVGCHCSDLAAP